MRRLAPAPGKNNELMLPRRHTIPVKQNKFLIEKHEHESKMLWLKDIRALKSVTDL